MGYWRCPEHRLNTGCECKLTPAQRVFTVRSFEMGVLFLPGPDPRSALSVGTLSQTPSFGKDGIALPLPFKPLAPFYRGLQGAEACPWTDRPFFQPPLESVVAGCAFPWVLSQSSGATTTSTSTNTTTSPILTTDANAIGTTRKSTTTIAVAAARTASVVPVACTSRPRASNLKVGADSSPGRPGKRCRLCDDTPEHTPKQLRRSTYVNTTQPVPRTLSPLRFPVQTHVLLTELNEHLDWVEGGLLGHNMSLSAES